MRACGQHGTQVGKLLTQRRRTLAAQRLVGTARAAAARAAAARAAAACAAAVCVA